MVIPPTLTKSLPSPDLPPGGERGHRPLPGRPAASRTPRAEATQARRSPEGREQALNRVPGQQRGPRPAAGPGRHLGRVRVLRKGSPVGRWSQLGGGSAKELEHSESEAARGRQQVVCASGSGLRGLGDLRLLPGGGGAGCLGAGGTRYWGVDLWERAGRGEGPHPRLWRRPRPSTCPGFPGIPIFLPQALHWPGSPLSPSRLGESQPRGDWASGGPLGGLGSSSPRPREAS